MALRLKLTEVQLRELRSTERPKLDAHGQPVLNQKRVTVLEDNPGAPTWRFVDGNDGAPVGFGVYVGINGAELCVEGAGPGR